MKINTVTSQSIEPKELAKCLAEGTAEEFFSFWLAFSQLCTDEQLEFFAYEMMPVNGGAGKAALRKLVKLIAYFETCEEILAKKEKRSPKCQ